MKPKTNCKNSLATWRCVLCAVITSLAVSEGVYAGVQTESFSLKEPLYARRGHGPEELLGNLVVCAQISDDKMPMISISISMPDSGQVLMVKAPMSQQKNSVATFNFDDDGWGNAGRGILQRKGEVVELTLEQTGAQPDADKNIRRNYGTYLLPRAPCN